MQSGESVLDKNLNIYQEYNMTYMHLIILVLMKLGRYDFVKKEAVEEKVADSK